VRRRWHFTFDACVASYARQLDQRPVVSDGPGCAIGNELNLNKGERWLQVWILTLETLDSGNLGCVTSGPALVSIRA
jgi:hypothetical protein